VQILNMISYQRVPPGNDPFTKIVINRLIIYWHRLIGSHFKKPSEGVFAYSEKWPLLVITFVSTVVASMLPVAAVFALQAIPPNPERYRLGAFAAFTFVFVVLMKIFTHARRADIFAAAAAFAAVQVVFIGTNNRPL